MFRTKFAILLLLLGNAQSFLHSSKPKDINVKLHSSILPNIDEKRLEECAENFGSCNIDEVQNLRDELHKERVQSFVFKNTLAGKTEEELMKHRIFEDELQLQLDLLQQVASGSTLFPEEENVDVVLPQSENDEMQELNTKEPWEKLTFEGNTIESVAICGFIALAILKPEIF